MMMSMMLNEMDPNVPIGSISAGIPGVTGNPFVSGLGPMSNATYTASPAPATKPGEVILRKLFHEFTILADKKIEAVLAEPLERPLAKSLQRGEDAIFDQLLTAFGSVAEHCLPSQLRILFEWHEKQLSATGKFIDDNINFQQNQQMQAAQQQQIQTAHSTTTTTATTASSIKSATDSQSSAKSNVTSISSSGAQVVGGSSSATANYPTNHQDGSTALDAELSNLLEKRDLAIEFIFCLVLIEVLKQLSLHPGYEELTAHIENLAFKHFKFHEDAQSKPNLQNINMIADLYAEVIGVLAQSRFQSVRKRFMAEFKELRAKEPSPFTTHNIISLLMGMKFFRIKMVPIEEFEASFLFMHECAVYFLDVKDKDIKHALAGLFVEILVPVAATVKNEVNVPCLKNFVELLYSQTLDLCTKKKHGLALFPLVTCLLCVSQKTFFLNNWHYFLAMCLSHLKNRDTKMSRVALESLYRLLWVYMIRIKCESNTATQSRLHSIVNSLFPKGSKAVVPRDTPLNIFVKIIQFIAQERLDFAMKEIVFDLLSVGRAIKIILTPERMSIGLRSFLVVADSLQQKDGEPPMPRTVGVLPSGNTLRVKKTFLNKMLTDEMAKNIGMNHYYPYVRKTFSDILRALDIQFGRPLMMTNLQNLNKEPDDMITGERKPKIDLFRTCVAAIPRLIPDGISKSDLIDLLARLTVHMDEEMNVLAFQSLQNLVVDFADWREEVIDGFVHFILFEINDAFQGLIENALRMLFQLLTSWRNAIQQQQQQQQGHNFPQSQTQQQSAGHHSHSGTGSGHNIRFSGNTSNSAQNALTTVSPTAPRASSPLTSAKMDQIANVLYNVDALALVMLCYCRQPTRRLAAYILKESRTISNLLLTTLNSSGHSQLPLTSSPSPGSSPAGSQPTSQHLKTYDEPVASIIDSHCPLIIEQSFPYISTNEKATIIALSYQIDLQWLAERAGNSWVFDRADVNQANSKSNSGSVGVGSTSGTVHHHIGSHGGGGSSGSSTATGINSVIDRKSSNTTLLNVVNSQTLLNTANLLQESSATVSSSGSGPNVSHPISANVDQGSSSSSENSADSELKLNAWNVCLMALMNEVSQKCPNAVALAWPIICQRLNTLFTHIDPNPANDNRASLILRGSSTTANLKRSISSFDRSFYLELWKNYLMFACRIAPSSIITPETAAKYYPNQATSSGTGGGGAGGGNGAAMQDNCVSPDSSLLESVKSSMNDGGTTAATSRSPIANRGISAQTLFKQVLPLIRCDQCDLRNAVILGLSQVNHFAFADLLENLVPCFREAFDKKQENLRRRRRREMLRVQIGRLFKYISERKIFTNCPVVLDRDNGLMSFGSIVVEYIDGVRVFFDSEPDKESNHHYIQDIKESYCHFVCNLLKNFSPEARANKLSRELRQNLFQMFASWSGRFGSVFNSSNINFNYDQMISFQSITELEYLSIRSMSTVLTSGSIFDVKNLLVEGNNLYYWLTNLLNADDRRINDIGLETLILLLENNLDDSGQLLEWLIECCYRKQNKIADACFTALATIFSIREYPCDRYIAIIIVTLVNVACPRIEIQQLALQLLQLLDNRFFCFPPATSLNTSANNIPNNNNNNCNPNSSVPNPNQTNSSNSSSQSRLVQQQPVGNEQQSNSTPNHNHLPIQNNLQTGPLPMTEPLLLNLYPCSQFNISKRMAHLHPQLTMIVFSEITFRFQTARPTVCQNLLHFMIPWLYNMHLVDSTNLSSTSNSTSGNNQPQANNQFPFHPRFDSGTYTQETFNMNGGGWGSIESTEMVLNNLFFITIKFGDDYAIELERVWAALCLNRPNNLKIIIRYLFILTGLAPNELLPYAKRIAGYLARSQPEHVIDELMTELQAVEFLSFNAERTEAFPYFRIINRKCSATHLDCTAENSASGQNRKSADRDLNAHSQSQSAQATSQNQQGQIKPEIGMLHTKRHSKDLQTKYDTTTSGGGGSDGSTKILLDQYRNNYDNFMANGLNPDEYNPLESIGVLGTELGYFNSSNSNNENSLSLSDRNYSTTKPSTPQPRPLPMPEYGGYYAPLNIFLLNPSSGGSGLNNNNPSGGGGAHHFGTTNINGTVNSSNIGFHRCNLALMLLCDIITQDIAVDWSPHIPLMLHILFLGMDHSKPIVYEHCKQLLLNLLIVTCKHRDNLNVARILLNNRIQQQNYGLITTYSTFPYNFNNSNNLNESSDSADSTATATNGNTNGGGGGGNGSGANNEAPGDNSVVSSIDRRHNSRASTSNSRHNNSLHTNSDQNNLDLNQIFTKSTENVFNQSSSGHQAQLSTASSVVPDSSGIGGTSAAAASVRKSTITKNRRSNSKQLYINLNEIHLNIMNEEQEELTESNKVSSSSAAAADEEELAKQQQILENSTEDDGLLEENESKKTGHLKSSNSIKRTKFSLDLYIKTLIDFISSKRNRQLWNYEDITAKLWQIRSAEQMSCFVEHVLFVFKESLPYAKIENRWAEIALQLALSCSSRHYAGRSLQIFRALKIPINSRMLSDILSRLVETVSEQGEDMQGYVTELMLTLESAIDSFDFRPRNILDLINEYFHFDNIDTDEFDDGDDSEMGDDGVDDEEADIRLLNDTQITVDSISIGDQLGLVIEREDINSINVEDNLSGSNTIHSNTTTTSSSSTLTIGNGAGIPNSQSQIECSLKMLNKMPVRSTSYSMSFPSRRVSNHHHHSHNLNQHQYSAGTHDDCEQQQLPPQTYTSTPNSYSQHHHPGNSSATYHHHQPQRFRPTIPTTGGEVDSFYSQKNQIRSKCNSLTSVATCGAAGGRSQSVQSFNKNNNNNNKPESGVANTNSNDPPNGDNLHEGYLMDVQDDDDKNSILAQFFWISVIMLETDYEHEFLLALRVLDKVLDKLSLDDNDCQEKIEKIFVHFKWHSFPGVHALLLKGCASPGNYEPTINLLHKLTGYLKITAIDPTKSEVSFPFHVMAMLPYLLHNYDDPNELCIQAAVSFAQWCNENSTKLENLATVMTLYSKRCFSKENSQWTKCVVKYLYDAFPGSFVQIISFLVEVAEKGPPVFLNHILSILHFMLNYIDLSTARLINTEIIRVAGRYIEGPQWKDALKILKLAVTRSSSLAAPSYSSSGSGYPSSIISSIVSGGTVGSAGAGSTGGGAYSDCISIASSSFAESEFSSFKRELPGRTMDFNFDLSQMPIVGLKYIRKRQNLENQPQEPMDPEARSKRDEYVVNELILGRTFDSDDEYGTGSSSNRTSRPSQICPEYSYSLRRNNQQGLPSSVIAQVRIRERLIGLLNRCGQRIGGLPKSPSVIFSQNSDIIEQINKSSMASSVEELSTTNNDISGDSKHGDHHEHSGTHHGGEFGAFFKEFDFLEYELESQEGESLDNFNWGVRRKSLSNLDNETVVGAFNPAQQYPPNFQIQQQQQQQHLHTIQSHSQPETESSELKQGSHQSNQSSQDLESLSQNVNSSGGQSQLQQSIVDSQSLPMKQSQGSTVMEGGSSLKNPTSNPQSISKDEYSSDDEVESSVSPSLYEDGNLQHLPHHHVHSHHHHHHHHHQPTPAPPTTPVVHTPLPPGLNNEIEEQWSTHFIQLINDNSGTTSAISNQILSLIFKNTFTRVIYLTRESCELLQQTAVVQQGGSGAISDQYRTIANRFLDLIDIISTQIDFPFVFIDPKLFTTIPKLLEKHRFRILELHAQWETFNEKKDFLCDCICQSRNQLNGGEYSVAKLCKHLYKMYFQLFLLFECYLKFVDVLKSVTTFPQIVNCSEEITTLKKELVKSIDDPLVAALTVDLQFESTIDSKLSKENESELKELITSKQFGKAIRFIRKLKTNISDFMSDDCIETLLTVYCKSLFETQSYYLVITEPEYNLSEITRQLMDASYVIYNDLCN